MHVLTVNVGSSSVKLGLFDRKHGETICIEKASLDLAAQDTAALWASFWDRVDNRAIPDLILHRVVHGGDRLPILCPLDSWAMTEIRKWSSVVPLHQMKALEWISMLRDRFPSAGMVACFDTGPFHDIPSYAKHYALPMEWTQRFGIRRFGFHGWAHRSMWSQYATKKGHEAKSRLLSIQLGSGCSVAACVDGKAVDCSMGFTALEGLVMASRSGDVDPGVLLYLLGEGGLSLEEVKKGLYASSGLLGMSGISGDMRVLLASDSIEAQRAVDLYCYRVRKYIGAFAAATGGLDAVLIGGGVGENAEVIREKIFKNLEWMGIFFDVEKNKNANECKNIASDQSVVEVWVLSVNEEEAMLEEAERAGLC